MEIYLDNITEKNLVTQRLDHSNVTDYCLWKDAIVTVSCIQNGYVFSGELKVWNLQGLLLCSHQLEHGAYAVVNWDKTIVTASCKNIEFWKLSKSKEKAKITLDKKYETQKLETAIIWNDTLFTISNKSSLYENTDVFMKWNKKGHCEIVPEIQGRIIKVFQDTLWVVKNQELQAWKQTKKGVERIRTLQTDVLISTFGFWRNHVVIAGFEMTSSFISRYKLTVWTVEGKQTLELPLGTSTPCVVAEWNEKLACVVNSQNDSSWIVLFDWNGSVLFKHQVSQGWPKILFGIDNRLWCGTDNGIFVWVYPCDWKTVRLLWIGWKKNKASKCPFPRLPKEVVAIIVSYLK